MKGFQAVEQHATSAKHKDRMLAFGPSQMRLATNPNSIQELQSTAAPDTDTTLNKIQLFNPRDTAVRAELVWVLKSIASDFPAAAVSEGIRETFVAMFPGSVPDEFTLSRTKVRYLVTDALAPYFRDILLNDAKNAYFTLCYDETTNAAGKKELQIAIRYWSPSKGRVAISHLQTYFIGSAKAEDILKHLNDAMQNASLSRTKLLMLGM